MITYRENRNDIIQTVEIDLIGITIKDIKRKLDEVLNEYNCILEYNDKSNRLVYKTEVLIPKTTNSSKLNIMMVLGNPAIHSVAERMFFSYEETRVERKWREHRFWRALRECEVLKFNRNIESPTCENIDNINRYKRDCILNRDYISDFNIFMLPYFSFPTPASGPYNGVNGIRKIVGKEIFNGEMKKFEFQRFENIVLGNDIKNVICFQRTAKEEIIERAQGKPIGNILNNPDNPVYELGNTLKHVTLYTAKPTRLIHTNQGKEILKGIVADIKAKNKNRLTFA